MITDGHEIERRARLMHVGAQVWAEAVSAGIATARDAPYVAGPDGEHDRTRTAVDAALDHLVRSAAATRLTPGDLVEYRERDQAGTYLAGTNPPRGGDWTPDYTVAPGEVLRECLQERGLTQLAFAQAIGRPPTKISEIVSGRKGITPETAIQLEEGLGVSAAMWVRLEADHRLALARAKHRRRGARRKR